MLPTLSMRSVTWMVLALALASAPCSADLRCGEATGPSSLNPLYVRDMSSLRAVELIYEGLVTPPEAGEVAPLLAESWEVSGDGTAVTFRLKRGVQWHDGAPFAARDVVFTVTAAEDPRSFSPLRSQFEVFSGAQALDDQTVQIRFRHKVLNPLLHFDFKVLPSHLYPGGVVDPVAGQGRVVGTGPFRFVRWASSGEITLEANPNYHRAGQPGISRVELAPVPDDSIRTELLRYGAIDLIPQVRPRDIPALEELTRVRLYPYSTLSYAFLGLNFRTAALREPAVRKALALGLARGEMLKAHYGNRGAVISGPFPPSSWAYNFGVKPWPYDPHAAASALDGAGLADRDKDGVREFQGAPLGLRLVSVARDEAQKAVVLDIQQQLRNIGIPVAVRFLEPMAWKKAVFEDHDFDLVLSEWTFDHSVNIYTLFHSAEAGPGQNNMGAYANPEVDRLLEDSRSAESSESLRAVYGELHRILHEDIPYVFLWSLHRYASVSSRIENVRLHPFYFFTYVGTWKEK